MSTSKPRSANAVATTLAPRSCPSWPELRDQQPRPPAFGGHEGLDLAFAALPTSRPPRSAHRRRRIPSASSRGSAPRRLRARRRSRRPSLGRGWRRSRGRADCPVPPRAHSVSAASAAATACESRFAFTADSRAICASRTAELSISRISIGDSSSSRYLLTPTITSLPGVDARLLFGGRRFDPELGPSARDRPGHAAHRLDFLDDRPRLVGHVLRQALHQVRAAPGIDRVADVRFLLDQELRVARDPGREVGGQRDRLVERVRVQRLRAAEHRGQRLDRGAHDVVVGVLLGQRPAGGLAMRAQHQRLRLASGRTPS